MKRMLLICFGAGRIMRFGSRNGSRQKMLVTSEREIYDVKLNLPPSRLHRWSRFRREIKKLFNTRRSSSTALCFARCSRKMKIEQFSINRGKLSSRMPLLLQRKSGSPLSKGDSPETSLITILQLSKQRSFIFASMHRVKLNSRKSPFLRRRAQRTSQIERETSCCFNDSRCGGMKLFAYPK